jgi:hypothetical protein
MEPDDPWTLSGCGRFDEFWDHRLGQPQGRRRHCASLEESASIELRFQSLVYRVCHINLLLLCDNV